MHLFRYFCLLSVFASCLTGCREKATSPAADKDSGGVENIDQAEREAAAKLKAVEDPIRKDMDAFAVETRKLFDARRFDDLEKLAAELRARKSLFRDGSWKIRRFYVSCEPSDEEPDETWKAVDRIHQEWIAAKPGSITAHVAHANFFVNYAWHVRGSGYSSTVSDRQNFSFEKRLESAYEVLSSSRGFPEKDPMGGMSPCGRPLAKGGPQRPSTSWRTTQPPLSRSSMAMTISGPTPCFLVGMGNPAIGRHTP